MIEVIDEVTLGGDLALLLADDGVPTVSADAHRAHRLDAVEHGRDDDMARLVDGGPAAVRRRELLLDLGPDPAAALGCRLDRGIVDVGAAVGEGDAGAASARMPLRSAGVARRAKRGHPLEIDAIVHGQVPGEEAQQGQPLGLVGVADRDVQIEAARAHERRVQRGGWPVRSRQQQRAPPGGQSIEDRQGRRQQPPGGRIMGPVVAIEREAIDLVEEDHREATGRGEVAHEAPQALRGELVRRDLDRKARRHRAGARDTWRSASCPGRVRPR